MAALPRIVQTFQNRTQANQHPAQLVNLLNHRRIQAAATVIVSAIAQEQVLAQVVETLPQVDSLPTFRLPGGIRPQSTSPVAIYTAASLLLQVVLMHRP